MIKNLIYCLLLLGLSSNEKPVHAIYLSTAKIDIQEEVIEIEIKVFMDDLQNAIRDFAPDRYEVTAVETFAERHKKEIHSYFSSHFQLMSNNERLSQQYISATIAGDVYLLKWQCQRRNNTKSFSVKADYFMELFPTQSNVIQLNYGNKKRFGRLKKGDPDLQIEL